MLIIHYNQLGENCSVPDMNSEAFAENYIDLYLDQYKDRNDVLTAEFSNELVLLAFRYLFKKYKYSEIIPTIWMINGEKVKHDPVTLKPERNAYDTPLFRLSLELL